MLSSAASAEPMDAAAVLDRWVLGCRSSWKHSFALATRSPPPTHRNESVWIHVSQDPED
jgi:hypothetical protein